MSRVLFLLHWDGEMKRNGSGDVWYSKPAKAIHPVYGNICLDDFKSTIHKYASTHSSDTQLKLVCRLPLAGGGVPLFSPVEIGDESTWQLVMDVAREYKSSIDIYVDVEANPPPIVVGSPSSNMVDNVTGQYASSLTQKWDQNLLNSIGSPHLNMSTLPGEHPCHEEAGPSNPRSTHLNCMPDAQNMPLFDSPTNNSVAISPFREIDSDEDGFSIEQDADQSVPEQISETGSEEERIDQERVSKDKEEEKGGETKTQEEAEGGGQEEGQGGEEEQTHGGRHMPNIPFFTNTDESFDLSTAECYSNRSIVYRPGGAVSVGHTFADKKSLINAVNEWSFHMNRQYIVVSSKKDTWYARCRQWKSGTCAWRLRGIQKSSGIWKVSKCPVDHHSCSSQATGIDMKLVTTDMIADLVFNKVVNKPSYPVKTIVQDVLDEYHVTVNYRKAWLARQRVIKKMFGGCEESYSLLPNFFLEVCHKNPRTIVEWVRGQNCAEPNTWEFKYVFWTFGPCVNGFKHCIPVISVDGTHLSGGSLLVATSIDGNRNIFLLAFAIVDGDNNDSWNWFMGLLRAHVIQDTTGVCIISDTRKSIQNVFQQPDWQEPFVFHRYCLRHIQSNFMTKFKDAELGNLCYGAGEVVTTKEFESVIEHIGRLCPQAAQWLRKIPLQKWTQSHDGCHRFGIMTTNMSESVKSMLKGIRQLPITALVQKIWERTVSYYTRGQKHDKECIEGKMAYPKKIHDMLSYFNEQHQFYSLKEHDKNRGVFECFRHNTYGSQESIRYVIELDKHVCSCGEWQSKQHPCIHVVMVANYHQVDIRTLIHPAYSIEEYSAWDLCRCGDKNFGLLQIGFVNYPRFVHVNVEQIVVMHLRYRMRWMKMQILGDNTYVIDVDRSF